MNERGGADGRGGGLITCYHVIRATNYMTGVLNGMNRWTNRCGRREGYIKGWCNDIPSFVHSPSS